MSREEIPSEYRWPGGDVTSDRGVHYWLSPDPDSGATALFMVNKSWPGCETILCDGCLLLYGIEIVDALRGNRVHEPSCDIFRTHDLVFSEPGLGKQCDCWLSREAE